MSPEWRLEDMNSVSPRKFTSDSHRNFELSLSYVREQADLEHYLKNRLISFAVLDKYCSVEQGDLPEIKYMSSKKMNVLTPQRTTSPLDRLLQDNIKTSNKRRSFKKKRSGKARSNRKTKWLSSDASLTTNDSENQTETDIDDCESTSFKYKNWMIESLESILVGLEHEGPAE